MRRTWDLRSYTGSMLALLSGRLWAYGYRHTERFLTEVAHAGGAEPLTDALARWTAHLWLPPASQTDTALVTVYIDGHRKPVYTDARIPRGLIGRTGAITGCRALILLHDAAGHPLLVTTARGDTHLTVGLPQILTRFERALGRRVVTRIIVDREGMSAAFLAQLVLSGRSVITLLRDDQYSGLDSFSEVGAFVPLCYDLDGTLIREVAPARFALPHPDPAAASLPLFVALVRDLHRFVPVTPDDQAEPLQWDADLGREQRNWQSADWVATPAPALPTRAKLIPIVSTAAIGDAVSLAQTYLRRWPVQENIIRDYLIPLGIDTNHGYAKSEVVNSEISKRREAYQQRLNTLKRWAEGARERCARASRRHQRLYTQAKARVRELDQELCRRQRDLEAQALPERARRQALQQAQAAVNAEMRDRNTAIRRAIDESNSEYRKQERYCQEQRILLRALEELAAREQRMYELDNAKDQVMTVCKVALANLVMWTREKYFPPDYAQATWKRLEPFFHLPGAIVWGEDTVEVSLRPFNDRQLNRDLGALCMRVAAAAPHLPDGRHLLFTIGAAHRLNLDVSPH